MPPPWDDTSTIFAANWYDIAKLKLQVILWDRWRDELQYSKQNPEFDIWTLPAQLPFTALTEEEMRAQLDALEEQDDSASGALGGD